MGRSQGVEPDAEWLAELNDKLKPHGSITALAKKIEKDSKFGIHASHLGRIAKGAPASIKALLEISRATGMRPPKLLGVDEIENRALLAIHGIRREFGDAVALGIIAEIERKAEQLTAARDLAMQALLEYESQARSIDPHAREHVRRFLARFEELAGELADGNDEDKDLAGMQARAMRVLLDSRPPKKP
jgi:hypothetical protein